MLQFPGETFSHCISAPVACPGLRNVLFSSSPATHGCSSVEKKEEVISYIRGTDIPGKTGQCAPRLSFTSEQQQGAPDSSSAVVYQFGMGRTIVAVMMEEARLFDLSLLTQWFSIWLYCGASQLHPCGRNSCSLSGEWCKREPDWAGDLR